jgi:photosystem II stability/assembly factor-like uncharacterized protein
MIMSIRKNTKILRAIFILLIFLTNVLLPNQASLNVIIEPAHGESNVPVASIDKDARAHMLESYGSLPLSFESNQGQSAAQVKFLAKGNGYNIFLTEDETVIKLLSPEQAESAKESKIQDATADDLSQKSLPLPSAKKGVADQKNLSSQESVLRMKLVGAKRPSQIRGVDPLEFKSNYFAGKDPSAWHTGISNFAKVLYEQVYDGVDMIFYGRQQQLEYDFQVAAGINPSKITMALEGAKRLHIDTNGDLVLTVGGKEIRQKKPVAFQEINSNKQDVVVRYVHKGKNRVGFQLGRYDKSKPLVIDPVLVYGTFLGGSSAEAGSAIDVDANGSAYVTGVTTSMDFPLMNAFPPAPLSTRSVFISKLNPTGTGLLYSSVIRVEFSDLVADIKVNSSGNAYIVGQTRSDNFPIANAIQPLRGGFTDAFIVKLNPSGSSLVYSTYVGGISDDVAHGVAVDGNDNAILVGFTSSPNFPVVNALQPTVNRSDAFVSKLNPTGSAFVYSTYLGGSAPDTATGITTDAAGNAYVVGTTLSGNFPLMNPVQSALADQTLLKSTNGGVSWAPLTNGLPAAPAIYDIEADPTQSATLYMAADIDGGYKSTNGGANWSAMDIPRMMPSVVREIEIAPTNFSTLYSGSIPGQIVRSTNSGGNWATGAQASTNKNGMAVSPNTESTIYLANATIGPLISTDNGATFDDLNFPNPNAQARCVAVRPAKQDVLYVGTDNQGIWKYENPVWRQTSMTDRQIRFIVIDPTNSNTMYTSTTSNLAKSTDSGATWKNISAGLTDLAVAETLAIDPTNPSVLYVGTRGSQVYKSVNGGTTWSKLNENRFAGVIQKIEIDPNSPNTLYVGAEVGGDAFVAKISPTGSTLLFSTYFGGRGSDSGVDIALDPAGNPVIAGITGALDLPTTALQQSSGGANDSFVAKFDIANHLLVYATYLGGSSGDIAQDIAVDAAGNAYITGSTLSTNFPTTPDAIPLPDNSACVNCPHIFLTKLNASGTGFIYSTYLGGSADEGPGGIAVDSANNAYVTGFTRSVDFPTTPNAFDRELAGSDAFIVKIAEGTPFPICLRDDTNGNVLRINTSVGEFEFVNCRKGWNVRGPLTTTVRGCKTELTGGGRTGLRLSGLINTCTKQGSATITVDGKSYSIADPSISGNECNCSVP